MAGTLTLEQMWGDKVVPGTVAGHDGLVYDPRPRALVDLLVGGERWAGRDYLVQGTRRLTHGAFRAAVPAAAQALADRGVRAGDRVLLLAFNSPDFVVATWALWWLGAVPVYGNRWWGSAELEHAVRLTEPVLALTDLPDPSGLGVEAAPLTSLSDVSGEGPAAHVDPDEDAVALVLFTSGSSGAPKGVALSQRSIIANQQNLLVRSRRLPQALDAAAPQMVSLVCTPLFHVGGVSNIFNALLTGARLVLNEGRFDPAEVLRLIEQEGVQAWGGVPTMAVRVLEHPDFEQADLSSLRSFPLGGAPLPPSLLTSLARKLPQLGTRGLANTWGMTETGGFMTVAGNADLTARPGTVGRPYPVVEVRIDEASGEVLVRSPTVMLGYVGLDDGTVDDDGWLHTGDLGHLDDDGYLFLDGRSKDIVIRGGENIACAQVEAALLQHPDVVEAAVVGVPHHELGEELAAVVRLRRALPTDELRAHLAGRVASFAVPSVWRLVEDPLPTLPGEKTDKKALARSLAEERS